MGSLFCFSWGGNLFVIVTASLQLLVKMDGIVSFWEGCIQ